MASGCMAFIFPRAPRNILPGSPTKVQPHAGARCPATLAKAQAVWPPGVKVEQLIKELDEIECLLIKELDGVLSQPDLGAASVVEVAPPQQATDSSSADTSSRLQPIREEGQEGLGVEEAGAPATGQRHSHLERSHLGEGSNRLQPIHKDGPEGLGVEDAGVPATGQRHSHCEMSLEPLDERVAKQRGVTQRAATGGGPSCQPRQRQYRIASVPTPGRAVSVTEPDAEMEKLVQEIVAKAVLLKPWANDSWSGSEIARVKSEMAVKAALLRRPEEFLRDLDNAIANAERLCFAKPVERVPEENMTDELQKWASCLSRFKASPGRKVPAMAGFFDTLHAAATKGVLSDDIIAQATKAGIIKHVAHAQSVEA